jgi:hypothetical protein
LKKSSGESSTPVDKGVFEENKEQRDLRSKRCNSFGFSGERWRGKKFNPRMKGKRKGKDGSQISASDIGTSQSVCPLVTSACELALWAVAFGYVLTCIEFLEVQGNLFIVS